MFNKIIKRDGRDKEYDIHRIEKAIKSAYNEVYDTMTQEEINNEYLVFSNVIVILEDELSKRPLTVEEIQEIILTQLKKYNEKVYEAYKNYRTKREIIREQKSDMMKSVMGLLDYTNEEVLKENANKKGRLACTQRDLIAGEVSKRIARSQIPPHILAAHDKGLLKLHDLDYWMQPIYNCELINLRDMLMNGTVINGKNIKRPHTLRTAMTITTQIAAQVASNTYGGQTISLSHIAPFVRSSENILRKKYLPLRLEVDNEIVENLIKKDLQKEIEDAVQTFNYQINTISCVNGQTPFETVVMYINEDPEYVEETAMLIKEFLKQRLAGMENEYGIVTAQTFPKLLYMLDEDNTEEGSKWYEMTKLAAECTANMMNPDYISVKKMKEVIGHVIPPMGCRAILSPFQDENGNWITYGRGNLGVQTINLPYVALESGGDMNKFWDGLYDALDLAREACQLRYDKLKGVKAEVAPILWCHGAISRVSKDTPIIDVIDKKGFTVTIGYSGIYETVKYLTGKSQTDPEGFELAKKIMEYMNGVINYIFKPKYPHLRIALYGTPSESTTGVFDKALVREFGKIKDVSGKGYITNSYHVDVRENIDAFTKLNIESKLQDYTTGGAISYIETYSLVNNVPAVLELVKHIYNTTLYGEINTELDTCCNCGFKGVMDFDKENLKWVCPNCKNDDQKTLSVIRRTCGYLGETEWSEGRLMDITNRVKHL